MPSLRTADVTKGHLPALLAETHVARQVDDAGFQPVDLPAPAPALSTNATGKAAGVTCSRLLTII